MAKVVKLVSLRLGDTFVVPPREAQSILSEGASIFNFTPPTDFFYYCDYDKWTHLCRAYSSSSVCLASKFPFDTLVIKFNL